MLLINRRNKRTAKNLKKFGNAKFNYAKFVKHYYMEKGEAYITVKVNSIEDIVSKYSMPDYEWINHSFAEYIDECAYYIPVEESIVLEITGTTFTEEEKGIIERVIKDYFGLELGDKVINLEINKKRSAILGIFALLSVIGFFSLYLYTQKFLFTELFAFGFWFFCWEFAEIAWLDRSDLRTEKVEAGQLATLKIRFLD